MSVRLSSSKILFVIALPLIISGCGNDLGDLKNYVDEVKNRKQGGIAPLPEIKYYETYLYPEHTRDPFDSDIIGNSNSPVQTTTEASASLLNPHINRSPEYLESFPTDTLRMVGTLEQNGSVWALVKTPDDTVQKVRLGNYIGQNYGKITNISEVGVTFTEIIPDGLGGYTERESSIALSE